MARSVFTNCYLLVNSVDLSNRVQQVAVNRQADKVEVTAMTATGKEYLPGLRDDSIEVTFRQDFASTSVDQTLDPLFAGGSTFLVKVAANGSSFSATNPVYSGTCALFEYSPISGNVGDALDAPTVFAMANGGSIVRGTA